MKTCGKCIKFDFCKRYVTENESFPEMPKGCPEFKRKPLFKRKQKGVIQMTDNEIKSALKCAILNAKGYGSKVWSIEVYKLEIALDLINRQKAENEELVGNIDRLKEENGNLTVEFQAMRNAANGFKNELFDKTELLKTATAEIERLKEEKDEYAYLYNKHINTAFSHIKAEAYKECIGKVKEYIDTYEHLSCEECECVPISKDELDNLLKELVGDDNA